VLNFPGEGGPTAYAAFSVSTNGRLSFQQGQESVTQMSWLDRAGNSLASLGPPGDSHEPSLSPDGKRIVIGRGDNQSQDLWMVDAARATMTRFTFDAGADVCPLWSADGSQIIFSCARR
jgi:Tol biopolymer transport system component